METKIVAALASGTVDDAVLGLARSVRAGLTSPPNLMCAFGSTAQPLSLLLPRLAAEFPESTVVGCSTAGEFTGGGEANGSVSLFALAGDFKIHAGIGEGLKERTEEAIASAIADLPASIEGYPYRKELQR
jgi:hypothetical protein